MTVNVTDATIYPCIARGGVLTDRSGTMRENLPGTLALAIDGGKVRMKWTVVQPDPEAPYNAEPIHLELELDDLRKLFRHLDGGG